MGLMKKIISGGSNKNDVKIAKLELEKAKIENAAKNDKVFQEKEKNKNEEKITLVEGYLEYSKNNIDRIENAILTLKSDIEMTVEKMQNKRDSKTSLREKIQLKKEKSACQENLKYLYLSNDFLLFLSKYASGIKLNEEQSSLIVKFARYFDGVKVIEVEEYGDEDEEEDDESLSGMLREVKKEFKEVFYKPKSSSDIYVPKKAPKFYFSEYLDKYHIEKINELVIPEVVFVIETFKKTVITILKENQIDEKIEFSQNYNECSNCHTTVSSDVKFCPECGSKIETPKPMICEECGSTLKKDTKFCSNCGHKVS